MRQRETRITVGDERPAGRNLACIGPLMRLSHRMRSPRVARIKDHLPEITKGRGGPIGRMDARPVDWKAGERWIKEHQGGGKR